MRRVELVVPGVLLEYVDTRQGLWTQGHSIVRTGVREAHQPGLADARSDGMTACVEVGSCTMYLYVEYGEESDRHGYGVLCPCVSPTWKFCGAWVPRPILPSEVCT